MANTYREDMTDDDVVGIGITNPVEYIRRLVAFNRVKADIQSKINLPENREERPVRRGEGIYSGSCKKNATHCKVGHELTPENGRVGRHGYKTCRICEKIYQIKLAESKLATRNV